MRAITTFSGIEGGGLGLERAGFEIAAQVEIDPFCQRVLARRYPNVPKFPDVTTFDPRPLGPVDLVCGGSPCQDLSVAGKRAGLAGERSGLFYELVRILDESAADWLLFENVPGLLSSHGGADFAIVLRELTGFEPAVPSGGWRKGGLCVGPDRAVAWRVLDAQYFGLAQRRQRLFLVANPRADRAIAVLHEPSSGAWDTPPLREAAASLAGFVDGGVAKPLGSLTGSIRTTDIEFETYVPVVVTQPVDVSNTIKLFDDGDVRATELVVTAPYVPDLAYSLRASESKQNGSPERNDVTLVATDSRVRRLTITERERLQGFPDGWTCLCGVDPYSSATCRCPDGPRARALGNAMPVNVIAWIARRIVGEDLS